MRTKWLPVMVVALVAAGCDPEAPVQSSDVEAEIDAKIAVHAADTTTHTNLLIPAANITGEIDGAQIEPDSIGLSQLATGSVASDEIADQSIGAADITPSAVGSLQLADNAVTTAKIGAAAVDASKLAPNAVTGGLAGVIQDQSITAFDLGMNSVAAAQVIDGSIGTAEITNDTIDDNDIANDALTAASLADNSVTANELANNAVDSTAIANNAVIDTKIASLAVTQAKLDTDFVGQRVDADSGNFNSTVFAFTDPMGGGTVDVIIVGACESTQAGSEVRLSDADEDVDAACPDVGNNNAIDGTPVLFKLQVTADNETVSFLYNAGANNETVAWEIYSFTVVGTP